MPQTFDRDKLQDEYEDAFFRLIMADYARAEGEILMRENEELKKDPANQPTPQQIQKFQRVMNKAFRMRAIKSTLRNTYHAINKAAVVIALIFVVFFVSTMTVQAIRVNVLNFLIGFETEYTSIQIGNAGGNSIIGDNLYVTWQDAYVPMYIPDGFKIKKVSNERDYKTINYANEDGRFMNYFEFSEANEINLDTEDAARVVSTTVQGCDALFVEKNGKLSIAWLKDARLFVISAQVSEDELFMIAEGVRFIK